MLPCFVNVTITSFCLPASPFSHQKTISAGNSPRVSSVFVTLTNCSYLYHSKELKAPRKSFVLIHLCTAHFQPFYFDTSTPHPGGGYPLHPDENLTQSAGDTVDYAAPKRTMTNSYLATAIEIAREAGKVLREEFSRPADITYKAEWDLVTQADKRSEAVIVAALHKNFPGHAVAAEEGSGRDTTSEFRWHVDPLDGTTNFAHGYPCFAVSIALAQHDTVIAGVVFNPFYNELFAAARGRGATLNGKPIHVSKVPTLSTSLLCTGFPVHKRLATPNIHYYWVFTLRSHGVRRDASAALVLPCVAAGRFAGFGNLGLQKWDTAAGSLLVEGAGGKVSDFSGQPYGLGGPTILATNGTIHEEMREAALEISQRDPASPVRRQV